MSSQSTVLYSAARLALAFATYWRQGRTDSKRMAGPISWSRCARIGVGPDHVPLPFWPHTTDALLCWMMQQ